MAEENEIPAGYLFQPTMLEVLKDYLRPKILKPALQSKVMHVADVYNEHPEKLASAFAPRRCLFEEWWFFARKRWDCNGRHLRRQSTSGRWHKTQVQVECTDDSGRIIGSKGSFTYKVRPEPTADWTKTKWLMEEFVYEDREGLQMAAGVGGVAQLDDGWVVCRIYCTPSARKKPPSAEKKRKRESAPDSEGQGNMLAVVAEVDVPSTSRMTALGEELSNNER